MMARILLVDDDHVNHVVVRAGLREYQLETAETLAEAFEKIQSAEFDVVLCDVVLPDGDGFDLLELLANAEDVRIRDTPVVMISAAFARPPQQSQSQQHKLPPPPAADYLQKPIARELLRRKVQLVLRERANARELSELRSAVAGMEARTAEILESPLQAIVRRLRGLAAEERGLAAELRKELGEVLRELARTNLFGPAVSRVVAQETLNPIEKSFLLETFEPKPLPASRVASPMALTLLDSQTELASWDAFNVFARSDEELVALVPVVFDTMGLLEAFNIDRDKLTAFARAVCDMQHKDAAYHSWQHLFDVLQAVLSFVSMPGSSEALRLSNLDMLALAVAALCHDIDHPGTTNSFQVNFSTDLALLYNDQSVLENHHASTGFRLLLRPELNFLSELSHKQFALLRRRVIDIILETDMSKHAAFASRWKALQVAKLTAHSSPDIEDSAEEQLLLMQLIVKTADASNVARPWEIAKEWAQRISAEFWEQSRRERAAGISVAPHMSGPLAQVQLAFIDYSASTLFSFLAERVPELGRTVLVELARNRAHWQEEREHEQ